VRNPIEVETGNALRRIRRARGMRLADVRTASRGRFSPTTVAGYERGEREISLRRFCDLCTVYQVFPERVLGRILRAVDGRGEIAIDLTKIEKLPVEARPLLDAFVRRVAVRRGTPTDDVVIIRAADIEVLATAIETSADALLVEIGASQRDDSAEQHARAPRHA
jgi:transcriptional regulator with XRE-family HTH domain